MTNSRDESPLTKPLTEDDIDLFYKIISRHSQYTDYLHPGLLKQLKNSYYAFIRHLINSNQFSPVDLRVLNERLAKVIRDGFFNDKELPFDTLQQIQSDIENGGVAINQIIVENELDEHYIRHLDDVYKDAVLMAKTWEAQDQIAAEKNRKAIDSLMMDAGTQIANASYDLFFDTYFNAINFLKDISPAKRTPQDLLNLQKMEEVLANVFILRTDDLVTLDELIQWTNNARETINILSARRPYPQSKTLEAIFRQSSSMIFKAAYIYLRDQDIPNAFQFYAGAIAEFKKIPQQELQPRDIEFLAAINNQLLGQLENQALQFAHDSQFKATAELYYYLLKDLLKLAAPLSLLHLEKLQYYRKAFNEFTLEFRSSTTDSSALPLMIDLMSNALVLFKQIDIKFAAQTDPTDTNILKNNLGHFYGHYAQLYIIYNPDALQITAQLYESSTQLIQESGLVDIILSPTQLDKNQTGMANLHLKQSQLHEANFDYENAIASYIKYIEEYQKAPHFDMNYFVMTSSLELMELYLFQLKQKTKEGKMDEAARSAKNINDLLTKLEDYEITSDIQEDFYAELHSQYEDLNHFRMSTVELFEKINALQETIAPQGISFFDNRTATNASTAQDDMKPILDALTALKSDVSTSNLQHASALIDEFRIKNANNPRQNLFKEVQNSIHDIFESNAALEQKPSSP